MRFPRMTIRRWMVVAATLTGCSIMLGILYLFEPNRNRALGEAAAEQYWHEQSIKYQRSASQPVREGEMSTQERLAAADRARIWPGT